MNGYQNSSSKPNKHSYGTRMLVAVLIILIVAFVLVAVPRPTLKLSEIDGITLSDLLGNSSPIIDKDSFSLYIDAVNSARSINKELAGQNLSVYTITYKSGSIKTQYNLYVDKSLNRKELFFENGSDFRKADTRYFDAILNNPVFDTMYEHNRPPVVSITLDGSTNSILPYNYEWQVKKVDQQFHPSKTDYLKGNKVYNFSINEKSNLGFDYESPPDSFHMDVYRGDVLTKSFESPENIANFLSEDGAYRCIMQLGWSKTDSRDYYGKATYEFELYADYPVGFEISGSEIDPGELLVIKATNIGTDEGLNIKTDIDFKPDGFQNGRTRVVLLPVSYYHKEDKTYDIQVSSGDCKQDFKVYVKPKEFTVQYLTIDTQVAAATRNEKSSAQMQDKVYPLKPISDPVQYWEGAFIQPVEGGRVTPADFGKRRYVNNAPTSYRHNGLDIGQDEGTPVKATNNGRVLLAEYLIETGNTIIIEHGYGLKSWYYHMSELKVKTGDMVKKGDVIGLVGSTGFSTAPHLHFSFTVNNVWINPITILEQGVPLAGDN